MELRYGMNPHQAACAGAGAAVADRSAGSWPVRVLAGEPSVINLLDALNGWQLVREAAAATGRAAAASFKHVSPAGAAVADSVTEAYRRARDVDPKSSFGDLIAVSEPVDRELAALLAGVVADGIVAPGFEPGVLGALAAKKHGTFLVLAADAEYEPPEWEERTVFGVRLAQQRDAMPVTADLLSVVAGPPLPAAAVADALLGLVTARYTQSNSVVLVRDGTAIGIGAGQQNRVDCVRLAAAKAATWWLRQHPAIAGLPAVTGMTRQERLNWQIRLAEGDATPRQLAEFGSLFASAADGLAAGRLTAEERSAWLGGLTGLTLVSDGYLPFRDNIDHAARAGVRYVVEPGGSLRSDDVAAACAEYGSTLVRTGLRLFHH